MFSISDTSIDITLLRKKFVNSSVGAFVSFEGWVRNINDGKEVILLEYEVYEALAEKEAEKIISEAKLKYEILEAVGVHRSGKLNVGDLAIWIGVTAKHRDQAYNASRYIVDEIKTRLPIWKKEHYKNENSEWINCACSTDF